MYREIDMINKYLPVSLIAGLLLLAAPAYGDAPAAAKPCLDCHGADGNSTRERVPSIAGVSVGVHADYLYAFVDGARECVDAETKADCSKKADLNDDQIEELAEYFSGLQYRPFKQDFDAVKAAAGAAIHEAQCDKCHSEGGGNAEDDAGILAGQPLAYMRQSLAQYAADQRDQPSSMQRKMVALSEADLEALAHYYAGQQ